MRSHVAGVASTLLLLTACTSGSDDASPSTPETVTATVTETVTATPAIESSTDEPPTDSTTPDTPAAPNVGDAALGLGQWREGTELRSRVTEFVQPRDADLPSYLRGDGEAEGAVAQVELCLRKTAPAPDPFFAFDLFSVYDRDGGQYTRAGSSWDEWPPRPQLPAEVALTPGRCVNGSVLFSVPLDTRVSAVAIGDGSGGVVAEWRVD